MKLKASHAPTTPKRAAPKAEPNPPVAEPNPPVAEPNPPVAESKRHIVDKVTDWAERRFGHQDPTRPHGPSILTHERPVTQNSAFIGFVEVGYTLSELNQIREHKGLEVVHVVNPDGSSNIEMIIRRFQPRCMHGHRFELQGPALNTALDGSSFPVGARFLGIGLTSDAQTDHSKDALSYTLEIKLTEKSAVAFAELFAPGIAHEAGALLAAHTSSELGKTVANIFLGAVPLISGAIALVSCRRAVKVCKNKSASKEQKAFAVAHATADLVRIVLPIPGTLMNVGLVIASSARSAVKLHHQRTAGQGAAAKSEAG